jgi:hypothetical protein
VSLGQDARKLFFAMGKIGTLNGFSHGWEIYDG